VTTTHALLAGKVQRKVRNGVANLPPPDHLWKILPMSAMRLDERVLAEIPGTRPELVRAPPRLSALRDFAETFGNSRCVRVNGLGRGIGTSGAASGAPTSHWQSL
jgi:hypothetical protein